MENHAQTGGGAAPAPVPPEGAQETEYIESLPMARYAFVVRGHLANGAGIIIRGNVYARKDMYYQAQARALDSILKEIPTLKLDETDSVGLRMYLSKKYLPPKDPPAPRQPLELRAPQP
ncbi:hypothetical protein OH491_25025 [Termitidicoccus mucosus]|uniref:Uncharacterized protein n=1 Tax=Termitidicoccus mucosus TaxID=1184151 RepID=A0A178IR49_9BACT|nr:hypothetical protein AW736_01520 [Opitutaceae bacterium TSB47]